MSAKPIIDIQISVDSLKAIKQKAIDLLKTLGYEYWYENPDPERMFFVKGMPPYGDKRTHHVHIAEASSKRLRRRIIFRDYLASHPETAREYERLKKELANLYTYDREQYTNEKTKFINEILQKSNEWKFSVGEIETARLMLKRPTEEDALILNVNIIRVHKIQAT